MRRLSIIAGMFMVGSFSGIAPATSLAQSHGSAHDAATKPVLFTKEDRDVMARWYRAHQNQLPAEFVAREHWSPTFEGRLHVGSVVEKDIRQWAYPMQEDLLTQLPSQPRHFRYVNIGNHACIIDAAWRLYDIYHFHG